MARIAHFFNVKMEQGQICPKLGDQILEIIVPLNQCSKGLIYPLQKIILQ